MKVRMERRINWVCALLVAAACGCSDRGGEKASAGPVDAGPSQIAEKEPNDRPEQAVAIAGNAIVAASLSADPSRPDEDWYVVSSPTPRQVDVALSGIAGADAAIAVFDQDRNPVLTVNSEGEGKGERFPNLGLSQKLFLRVTGGKKGSGGAYTLTVLFSDPITGFEREPNDRAADAHPLQLGQPGQGFLAHSTDQDWYRVEIPPPSPTPAQVPEGTSPDAVAVQPEPPSTALRIDVTALQGVRLEVAVLSAAEAPLFEVRGKDNEALTLRNVGVRADDRTVFVVVKSAWTGTGKDARRGFSAEQPYSLSVSVEPAGANAELEPNDDLARATPLTANGFREGFISPKTDLDYFVLRTPQPVLARFQLSGVDRVDLALELVRPKEGGGVETVLRANDGELKEPEQLNNVACSGECFVKVEGALKKVDGKWVRDYENAEQAYRLHVTVLPDSGAEEREPNASVDTATAIALGQPIRGTIQPKKDVDYYRLDLSNRPARTPIQATLLGILKVDVGLYLHHVEDGGALALVQTSDRAKGDQPEILRYSAEPGIYVLEVRDSTKRNEANFQDRYQLTVQEGE
ncbi:MAG TPA: ABC transporter substrate-binding protein [Myxococcaceae bacterium]|nr:ABC transporter substrate-binding protein [Myxococcaceae bacterium]